MTPQMVAQGRAGQGGRIALSDEQTMTFAEFDARALQLVTVFAAPGAKAGDVIGLYLPSRPELAWGYSACQKLGEIGEACISGDALGVGCW